MVAAIAGTGQSPAPLTISLAKQVRKVEQTTSSLSPDGAETAPKVIVKGKTEPFAFADLLGSGMVILTSKNSVADAAEMIEEATSGVATLLSVELTLGTLEPALGTGWNDVLKGWTGRRA